MAGSNEDRMSNEDLLRIFLLKFLSDADLTAYVAGTFVNGQLISADLPIALNVDTTPT